MCHASQSASNVSHLERVSNLKNYIWDSGKRLGRIVCHAGGKGGREGGKREGEKPGADWSVRGRSSNSIG